MIVLIRFIFLIAAFSLAQRYALAQEKPDWADKTCNLYYRYLEVYSPELLPAREDFEIGETICIDYGWTGSFLRDAEGEIIVRARVSIEDAGVVSQIEALGFLVYRVRFQGDLVLSWVQFPLRQLPEIAQIDGVLHFQSPRKVSLKRADSLSPAP